ncbi:hypothetical protein [Sorangium sp. So ce1335]
MMDSNAAASTPSWVIAPMMNDVTTTAVARGSTSERSFVRAS